MSTSCGVVELPDDHCSDDLVSNSQEDIERFREEMVKHQPQLSLAASAAIQKSASTKTPAVNGVDEAVGKSSVTESEKPTVAEVSEAAAKPTDIGLD